MSYYYNFYIGYIDKTDGKIYPYGPFNVNDKEKIRCIMDYSRSFDYDFSELFDIIPEKMYSDKFLEQESFKSYIDEKYCVNPKYLRFSDLPDGSYIKTGYFLIDQVRSYLEDGEPEFYDVLDPLTYNGMVAAELQFGPPTEKTDEWGNTYTPKSVREYMYFAYPDYTCPEFRAFKLRTILNSIIDFEDQYGKFKDQKEFVVIETEG